MTKINYEFIQKIFNRKISLKKEKDKIKLSKYNEYIPMYDIYSLDNNLDLFLKRLTKKRNDTIIGSAIMDQKVSAGVGNYIRAESLYIAKLDPFKKIKDISKEKLIELWDILRQIGWYYYDENKGRKLNIINGKFKLSNLYKKSGPSKYKKADGYFLVYREKTDPFGNKVTTDTINTRTIHYVKKIQK